MSCRQIEQADELLQNVEDALIGGRMEMHYQPIVAVQSGRCAGFESLCRCPALGFQSASPARYLSEHADTSVRTQFFQYTFSRVLEALDLVRVAHPGADISLNLPLAMFSAHMCDWMAECSAGRENGLAGLTLEISEATDVEVTSVMLNRMLALKSLGVRLALDDYGVGFSGDRRVSQLPLDTIKLDKTLLPVSDNRIYAAKLRSQVSQWQRSGKTVVLECVENLSHWEFARRIGCDYAQGYFISREIPLQGVPGWPSSWSRLAAEAV